MQFIIFDLEATCWSGNKMGRVQEVIEIGAFRVDDYGDVSDDFQTFVRPQMNPVLSVYCRKLTGIRQDQVGSAPGFPQAVQQFYDWIHARDERHIMCSWGKTDQELLRNDCALYNLEQHWLDAYVDLKEQYHHIKGYEQRRGLKRVLENEGLEFDGQHHRALDDAANLVKLFTRYLDMWMH